MIKLQRAPKPAFLTDAKVSQLVIEFKSTGQSVWNIDHIKTPLLLSSHKKCAYCECPVATESNYMEVEHFEDKGTNPDKVVEWENLLPSCKKCNVSKGTHNVLTNPMVNPFQEDPRLHLAWRHYRLRGKTSIGKTTIDVAKLNHVDRLVVKRFEIGQRIEESIETAWERFNVYSANPNARSKNRVVNLVEGLLKECIPQATYAASSATHLLTDKHFLQLVVEMKAKHIWEQELEDYFQAASTIVLDVV